MSTQNPTHGTKVTTEPAPEIEENAGAVASDSLAAESSNAGGAFSENRGSAPSGVSGKSSTFANKNTSGADKLPPTSDASSRPDDNSSYPDGLGGQSKATAVEDTTGSSVTGGSTSVAGTAPTYVNNQYIRDPSGPKGKNLTEGGFESDDKKNASWTSDIGDKNDPSRLAEERLAASNQASSGGIPTQKGPTGDGQYDALGGDTEA